MLSRLLTSTLLLGATALAIPVTPAGQSVQAARSVRVNLTQPTLVHGKLLWGKYLLVHDESRAARGEPCTAFYRHGSGEQPAVEFYCVPRHRAPAANPMLVMRAKASGVTTGDVKVMELTEYQFAGDREAHGVPTK